MQDGLDVSLIKGAATGDRQCLATLYDRYSSTLLAVAQRILHDRREAEDVLQDFFLEVWIHAADYDEARGPVRTWLLMRIRSRSLDRCKRVSRRASLPPDDRMTNPASSDDPTAGLDRGAVRRALALLPELQRTVLELGYFEGLSQTEIAKRVGSPLGTVKSRVAAALAKLRADVLGVPLEVAPEASGPVGTRD